RDCSLAAYSMLIGLQVGDEQRRRLLQLHTRGILNRTRIVGTHVPNKESKMKRLKTITPVLLILCVLYSIACGTAIGALPTVLFLSGEGVPVELLGVNTTVAT